jgi:hypothetical protein
MLGLGLVITTVSREYVIQSAASIAVAPSGSCVILFTPDGRMHRIRWYRPVEVRAAAPADDDD